MTSDTADSTTYWRPARMSMFLSSTPKYTRTPADNRPSRPRLQPLQNLRLPVRRSAKDLGMQAMSYGYVYVAQISMGADMNQTLKALREAASYDGPSWLSRTLRALTTESRPVWAPARNSSLKPLKRATGICIASTRDWQKKAKIRSAG